MMAFRSKTCTEWKNRAVFCFLHSTCSNDNLCYMPYDGETSGKASHSDIVRNPDVQAFLERCDYQTEPSDDEAEAIASRFSSPRNCIDRRHPLQVFRDMVNTFPWHVEPLKKEVHHALEAKVHQDGTPP